MEIRAGKKQRPHRFNQASGWGKSSWRRLGQPTTLAATKDKVFAIQNKHTTFGNNKKRMERFFSLAHLTVDQLHELYRDACKVGKLLVEYDKPREEGYYEIPLPEDVILGNIGTGNHNHLVFHEDFDDFPDATTVVFPLAGHLFMTAYIDIDNTRLDWFVKKYGLDEWWQMEGEERKYYPFSKFYTLELMKRRDLN